MTTIQIAAHVGEDGILKLELPVEANADYEIIIKSRRRKLTHDEWLAFIDETAGSLADHPIERLPQPSLDIRDELEDWEIES